MNASKKNRSITKPSERHVASEDDQESVEELLSKLPKGTPPELRTLVTEAAFSGPLPPPTMFEHYDQVLPGAADRILSMAETEQQLRKRDTKWMLTNDTLRVIGSLFVSILLISAGVYLGKIGEPWLGGVLGTSGVFSALMAKVLKK